MSEDTHWLDEQPAASAAAERREAASPPRQNTPLGTVAVRIADVSPAWASVTSAPDALPAASPGVTSLGRDRAFGVESIREGWLLHRGAGRVAADASPDLSLLIGDWCYAAGLCSIADHGSLDDVDRLASLVAEVSARAAEPIDALEPRWRETVESLEHG